MKKILLFLVVFIVFPDFAFGSEIFSVGLQNGFGIQCYSSDFQYLNSQIACGKFTEGTGFAIRPELVFEKPTTEKLSLQLRFGFMQSTGNFHIFRYEPAFDITASASTDVKIKNEIETTQKMFTFYPGVKYQIIDNLLNGPLSATLNLGLSFPLSSTFTQKEYIESPENAYFIFAGRNVQSRTLYDGDINNTNKCIISISPGITNQINLSQNLSFTQSIVADITLNDYIKDAKWKAIEPSLAIGLRYAFFKKVAKEPEFIEENKEMPELPPTDTEIVMQKTPEVAKVDSSISLRFEPVNPEQFTLTGGKELFATPPLLNVVFFEQGSAKIPVKYSTTALSDSVDYFGISPLEATKYSLLRIADILVKNPNSSAVICGFSAKSEPDVISQQRAEAVAGVLISLGTDKKRITVKTDYGNKNLSNEQYPEGSEENSRVEIQLVNASLLKYISQEEYAELNGIIAYSLKQENFASSEPCKISIPLLDTSFAIYDDGTYSFPVEYRKRQLEFPLRLYGTATKSGIQDDDYVDIEMPQTSNRNEILRVDRFCAVLRFDYNSSDISKDNKQLLRDLVKILPKEISKITVLGSTDMVLGTAGYNEKLGLARSENVAKFVKSLNDNITTEVGINKNRFPDNTPEGRFLNRSVTIFLK